MNATRTSPPIIGNNVHDLIFSISLPSSFKVKPSKGIRALIVTAFLTMAYLHQYDNAFISRSDGNKMSTEKATVTPTDENIPIYKWSSSFVNDPPHLTPINPSSLILLGNENIDTVHRRGNLHFGSVFFVIDASGRFLLLQRSASVVTCRNKWSILGEHHVIGEDAKDVPLRALHEELGLAVSITNNSVTDNSLMQNKDNGSSIKIFGETDKLIVMIQNVTMFPLYYIRHYGARNDHRIDRQLTYVWLVKLSLHHENISWKFDDEVKNHTWITINDLESWLTEDTKSDSSIHSQENEIDDGPPNGLFCHHTIRSLYKTSLDSLKILL